jgi:hypothetical protein
MKTRWALAVAMTVILAGVVPATAQMMGGSGPMPGMSEMMGMMGMMGRGQPAAGPMAGCPGMTATPAVFGYEAPWISFALAHEKELALTPDQVKALTTLREEFGKDATRLIQDIRTAETALDQLYAQKPLDLSAVEAKIKEIATREAELRIARVKALDKGVGLLTDVQRQKLFETARPMGRMMGA